MMKKIAVLVAVLLLIACVQAENLLYNADFSLINGQGRPEFWNTSAWNGSNSQFGCEDGALTIFNFEANDARWTQTVEVKPNTRYLFSCLVKAEDCDEWGRGANISVLNTSAYSDSLYDTDGEWVLLELYGLTGPKQKELDLCLRIGGYSGDGTGKAWFKDVKFEKADAESEYTAVSFATYEPSNNTSAVSQPDPELPERNTETWVLFAFGTFLAYAAAITAAARISKKPYKQLKKRGFVVFSLVLMVVCALAVRLYAAFKTHGYAVDVNCFMCWSEAMISRGFGLYADGYFCDYPPLYMMMLGGISLIRKALGVTYGSQVHIVLIKLIPMLADILASLGIYSMFRKKAGHIRALILACAIAMSPAFIADSAVWGQVDSLLALGLGACVYFAMESKWQFALPVYALTLLTKPQALLFGPIGLIALAVDVIKNKKRIVGALIGLVSAFAIMYCVSLPFALKVGGVSPLAWIFGQLTGATAGYKYITVNACNLYTLLGRNWAPLEGGLMWFAWVMFGVAYIYCAVILIIGKGVKSLPLSGAVLMSMLFSFAPMMHERYMFPVLLLTAMAYTVYRDKRLLWYLALATATQFVNIILPLEWGMTVGFESYGHLQSSEQTLNAVVSALNVLGSCFIMYTAFDIVICGHVFAIKPRGTAVLNMAIRAAGERDYRLHIGRFDVLAMTAVTVLYGVFAFWNLGTTDSPESYLKTTDYREEIIFDLGEVRTYRMTYFGGIADCAFTVALSNDGVNWTEENYADYAAGEMYRWKWYVPKTYYSGKFSNAVYDSANVANTGRNGAKVTYASATKANPLQTSRYVRFTVMGVGLVLNEVAFINTETDELYEVKSVTGSVPGNDYLALIDEQDKVSTVPSYYNGMYFDEIYHARTAYEMLHGYRADEILEWSHPHLGKLIIAIGIKLFGMTPFGWRSAGAFVGTLMLPVMYLLVKQLTGKRKLALVGMLLLTFDSMHYTQSRIATVDVYAVFFIMLMYLFMIRYFYMNLHREKLIKTFVPLGLSGVFMSLGIASKWICIYAAAGLAVIFFISIFMRFNEYLVLRKDEYRKNLVEGFTRKLVLTAVFCVAVFIILPAVVYYLSYYWHFATSGGLSVKKVWELQQQMFMYHSGLSYDTHYFRSPWYEWPLIIKPMWYYSADTAYVGLGSVSSISCMGNPAVWWTGLVCMIAMLIMLVTEKKPGREMLLCAIGFAAQFLPWVLVPRSTFIYHYFASVPFIIIATLLILDRLYRVDKWLGNCVAGVLIASAAVLFAMFYPLESGFTCAYSYALKLRWFNWYNFALQ